MERAATQADRPLFAMNTTPLIDVMLVLLIMFIITIPPPTHAVKIDLPAVPIDPAPTHPFKNTLTIDRTNALAWNGVPITLDQLGYYLDRTKAFTIQPELQVQPHPDADFVVVDRALAIIKGKAIESMGFVGNEQYARSF